jgi:hypothetical protein
MVTIIVISFFVGLLIGAITLFIFEGNPIIKILIDVSGFIAILLALFLLMPTPNADTSIAQATEDMGNFLTGFFGILIPYAIGDAASAAGYRFFEKFM